MKKEVRKYRLGNQAQEYELREDYLDWLPEYFENWNSLMLIAKREGYKNVAFSIFNTKDKTETKTLIFHRSIIKDAFPLSFFGEERSKEWNSFAIVSEQINPEKFIIPLVSMVE